MNEISQTSKTLVPRVLSFFLPQFYPIPLNDKWHGVGFTEWTKVKASTSRFKGHEQPRVPHDEIGYYRLDNPDTLRKQASLMKLGGLDGQIFYHYWFMGEQILEKPAQILLDNPDIQMDFCFCWANESWSRKWDGESGEIILKQDYSLEDSENFIRYLLPFFRDKRYIKVNDRPVLFVYRTDDIPGLGLLVERWNAVCLAEGINAPYLVAVQTGNNFDAAQSGFSAEAERPTYHVEELKNLSANDSKELQLIKGKVVDYAEVVELYTTYTRRGFLPVIPGLVVAWDPSPRHGTDKLILTNRSPEEYGKWLIDALNYSANNFVGEEAFVVINAWNEWAEGAYLEPDTAYGFAYLEETYDALLTFRLGETGKE